jgi:hypothetical protein
MSVTEQDRERLETIIEARWRMATTDVQRFANEAYPSSVNSKRMTELMETVEELALRLVDDAGEADGQSFEAVWVDLAELIHARLTAWAVQRELEDLEGRKVAAA